MASLRNLMVIGLASLANAVVIDMEGLPDTGLDTSSWTTGTAPPISSLVDLNDMQIAAKNTLSPTNYAYYRTAALDEITYRANMLDWNKIRLNGFSFADVSNPNLKTSILGYQFNAPFFIAPAAQAGLASGGAESNLAKAAGAAGILYVPSISSTQSIETIGGAASNGQVMFHQEYIWSDQNRLQDELNRMKAAGFKAIFLTVDNTGISGVRDRQERYWGNGGDAGHSATFTIAALNTMRNMTDLPIVPKGIKTAQDVKLCADLGFPAVYISNHGGRVVDLAPTAVEILLDVHRLYPEVFSKLEIYVDGGVRRATHILILLALGARAVGIGRSFMYANVYGQQGVAQAISQLKQELTTTMALMGQADVNGYRGNTSYINTRQIELQYFGAPLNVDTNSSPFAWSAPVSGGGAAPVPSSSTSSKSTSTSTSSTKSTSTSSVLTSPSVSSSTTITKSTSLTSSTTAPSSTFTTSTTASAPTTTGPISCPASNSTTYIASSGHKFLVECGIDHRGGDLSSAVVSSFQACVDLCDATAGCVDISMVEYTCYLKQSLSAAVANSGVQGAKLVT